jgi:2-(1,2-epoxy-1,2-dihydrophenyl)acetyl-CoA isomerase
MYENILLNIENGVAAITVNRPKSKNALSSATFLELADAFNRCAKNDEVRCLVVAGAGGTFSSGGDIEEFMSAVTHPLTIEAFKQKVLESGSMAIAARQCCKPIIAQVEGACFGAGISLALCCDFRVITTSTKMCTAFANVGFPGDTGAMFHLKEMVGLARMQDLMMTARVLEAPEIMSLGLANKMAEPDQIAETVAKMARRFANGPTATYARQKKLYWEFFFRDYDAYADIEAQYMAECTKTEDFKELVTAFLEKRAPKLIGK